MAGRKYVANIPCGMPNPSEAGVRRKVIFSDDSEMDKYVDEVVERDCEEVFKQCQARPNDQQDYYWTSLEDLREDDPPARPSPSPYDPYEGNGATTRRGRKSIPPALMKKYTKLVRQENLDVDTSKLLLKDMEEKPSYRQIVERQRAKFTNKRDIGANMPPETAAAMLRHEEMENLYRSVPPATFFGQLFPEDTGKPVLKVAPASRKKWRSVLPMGGLQQEGVGGLFDDVDAGILEYDTRAPLQLPWPAIQPASGDLDEVLGVAESDDAEEEAQRDFKYVVSHGPSGRANYAQLRGSEKPIWFPNYPVVYPNYMSVHTYDEPNEILETAWRHMKHSRIHSPHGNILLGR